MGGDLAEIPDQAEQGEELQRVVGDVDFPPEKALASGGHVVVMIVVPAFAERQEREKPVVLAGVGGLVADSAEKVRERVDRESVVPEEHGAEDESPEEEREAADQVHRDAEDSGRDEVIFVEPA